MKAAATMRLRAAATTVAPHDRDTAEAAKA
jgi:hypothetical protein